MGCLCLLLPCVCVRVCANHKSIFWFFAVSVFALQRRRPRLPQGSPLLFCRPCGLIKPGRGRQKGEGSGVMRRGVRGAGWADEGRKRQKSALHQRGPKRPSKSSRAIYSQFRQGHFVKTSIY